MNRYTVNNSEFQLRISIEISLDLFVHFICVRRHFANGAPHAPMKNKHIDA